MSLLTINDRIKRISLIFSIFIVILDSSGTECQTVNFYIGGISTTATRQWDITVTQVSLEFILEMFITFSSKIHFSLHVGKKTKLDLQVVSSTTRRSLALSKSKYCANGLNCHAN